jgi:hypothetical protein
MALNSSTLKSDIITSLEGQGFVFNDVSQLDKLIDIIATAVVAHIQTMGVVNTVVTGTSQSGGPVTGTGVGTVS